MKARPRIGTDLTEPVCSKGLNGARQENHAETCDEKDHSPHRKTPKPNGTNCVIAIVEFALAREFGGAGAGGASTVACRR
jgi:hypothetical protein